MWLRWAINKFAVKNPLSWTIMFFIPLGLLIKICLTLSHWVSLFHQGRLFKNEFFDHWGSYSIVVANCFSVHLPKGSLIPSWSYIRYSRVGGNNRYSAVKVLNSIKMGQRWRHNISGRQQPLGSHVKFNSLLQKTKMPGAPKLQSLLKILAAFGCSPCEQQNQAVPLPLTSFSTQ